MLEQIRKQSQSALIVLLFGFIIFVFVFSFGAGSRGFRQGGCGRAAVAAKVNGETVSDMTFSFYLRTVRKQGKEGKALKLEERQQIRQEVMQSLVDQAILRQAAYRNGLHVSDEERNDYIRSIPYFQDEGKHFDFRRYKSIVQAHFETSLAVFEEVQREEMLARRMAEIIQMTARVTDDELLQAFNIRETKVDIEFVKVPAAMYLSKTDPTEGQIDLFLKDKKDEVAKFYDAHKDLYHKPKQVQVAHVLFEVREGLDKDQVKEKKDQAEISLDDLSKGADFASQAKEYSEDEATKEKGGELPMMTRELMAARWGAEFAEAAFQLEEGLLSAVVKSDKGFHVLKCLKLIPAEDHPLAEVEKGIAKELYLADQADQKAKAEAERLLAGLKLGKKLADLVPPAPKETAPDAKPTGLEVDSTGPFTRNSPIVPNIGINEAFARAAFALTPEKPLCDGVFTLGTETLKTYVVFDLIKREEPDLSAFQETKMSLTDQLLFMRRSHQLQAWSEHQRAKAKIEVNQAFLQESTSRQGLHRPSGDDY